MDISEDIKKEVQDILDRERWQGYVSGKVEGALNVLYAVDLSKTIIGNCDTYIYMGGNDVETAKAVADRCDIPVKKILNMPVGTNWIF